MQAPSFAAVRADTEFAKALERDGLPALYPRPARWALDDAALSRVAAQMGTPPHVIRMVAGAAVSQRRNDAAYKHLCLLVKRAAAAPKRSPRDWRDALLTPAGAGVEDRCLAGAGDGPVDANGFMRLVFRELSYAPDAGAACPPEAKLCDHCGCVTACQCACGESFCSRACLAATWKDHAGICYTIHDNGELGYTVFNKLEFGEERGPAAAPRANALCCSVCGVGGARSRCPQCRAAYCGKWCQKLDWRTRGHKAKCAEAAAANVDRAGEVHPRDV